MKNNRCKENNPNFGKHFTKEHRKKLSQARLGITYSKETLDKISKNHVNVSGDKNPRAIKVKCEETGEIFFTLKEACAWCKLKSSTSIKNFLDGTALYAGKHPVTKEKLHWSYVNNSNKD